MRGIAANLGWMARIVPGLVGLAWFLGLGGGKTLDPTYVDWALKGDLFAFPPPLIAGTAFECSNGRAFDNADIPLALLAYHRDLKFNGGYLARIDPEKAQAGCDGLQVGVQRGNDDPFALVLARPDREPGASASTS